MKRLIINIAACVSITLLIGGCGSSTAADDARLPLCDGSLTVTVTQTATTPVISWSPACLVNRLIVQDAGGPPTAATTPGTVWELAPPTAPFGPPVQFGTPPRGVATEGAVGPLHAGEDYTVSVSRVSADTNILSFGSTTFQR